MKGPAPKDPQLRQRRNRSASRATLTREAEPRKRAPSLPKRADGKSWHKMTRAWWRDVWQSPMAAEYLRADEHALLRLAELIDLFWNNPTKELAAEIRLQQQAFGLTPLDRRRLEWSIEQVEAARTRTTAKRERKRKEAEGDPRELLQSKKAVSIEDVVSDAPIVG